VTPDGPVREGTTSRKRRDSLGKAIAADGELAHHRRTRDYLAPREPGGHVARGSLRIPTVFRGTMKPSELAGRDPHVLSEIEHELGRIA
jgi:hypothetical protein